MTDLLSTTSLTPIYYDNTRLTDFKECERKYYFRHIRHLVPEGIAPALVFGLSWHEAMDTIWDQAKHDISDDELIKEGMATFVREWKLWGYPDFNETTEEWESLLKFRTLDTALEMLYNYVQRYRSRLREYDLLAIEQPFAVPISEENERPVFYVGRLDKVYRWRSDLWIGEHKTSSLYKRDGYFRTEFVEGFDPNSQVDGYIHSGHMYFPDEKFTGVMIDAALVHGSVHDGFKLIPIEKKPQMLESWLGETIYFIDAVEQQKAILAEDRATGGSLDMAAFPRRTTSCVTKFGLCQYHKICKYHPNPETAETFEGFHSEKWEPFSILKLAQIGMKEEV